MNLDRGRIEIAQNIIQEEEGRFFRSGQLQVLEGKVLINDLPGSLEQKLSIQLSSIDRSLWDIEAIAHKLDFIKDQWSEGTIPDNAWMMFAASDIHMFHYCIRSCFDFCARLIGIASDSPRQIRYGSFNKLKNWVKKPGNSRRIGEDLAHLIISCDWFDDLKDIRDYITHADSFTLVFPEKGRILYHIYHEPPRKIYVPEVMYNDTVVDFELFGGLCYGYLLAYLEEVATAIINRHQLEREARVRSLHSGMQTLSKWMNDLLLR